MSVSGSFSCPLSELANPGLAQPSPALNDAHKDWEMQLIAANMHRFIKDVTFVGIGTLCLTSCVAYSNLPLPAKVLVIVAIASASLKLYSCVVHHTVKDRSSSDSVN